MIQSSWCYRYGKSAMFRKRLVSSKQRMFCVVVLQRRNFNIVEIARRFSLPVYITRDPSTRERLDRQQKLYKGSRRSLSSYDAEKSTFRWGKTQVCFVSDTKRARRNTTKRSCESTSPTGKDSLALVRIAELTRRSSTDDNRR